MEILAPAGGREQLIAAVYSGADAVYLGTKGFNARRKADNFGEDELKKAVAFCHGRGVRVHVTVNTLVTDSELSALWDTVREVAESGADAVILQDMAATALFREHVPDLPRHASTQMSIHNAEGARLAQEMGFSRVILARELSLREIREIREAVDIELECFVHGALCMGFSGQCLLSAFLGERSGNRGLCAQPCRLDFRAGERNYALSLKDACLIPYCRELAEAGVSSLKIEGRLRRPEYVAAAVDACRKALAGEKPDLGDLERVFSRSGFTDGYLRGKRDLSMFGRRTEEDKADSAAVLGRLSGLYRRENSRVDVDMALTLKPGQGVTLTVSDGLRQITVSGPEPEPVRTQAPEFRSQLARTGGTPFRMRELELDAAPGWTAKLNPLRREALDRLLEAREQTEPWPVTGEFHPLPPDRNKAQPKPREKDGISLAEFASADANKSGIIFREDMRLEKNTAHGADCASEASAGSEVQSPPLEARRSGFERKIAQPKLRLRFETKEQFFDLPEAEAFYLPVEELDEELTERFGPKLIGELPRLVFPGGAEALREKLRTLQAAGLRTLCAGNPGTVLLARELGFRVSGGFDLNVLNSRALEEWAALGVEETLLSPEIRLAGADKLGGRIPRGIVAYGSLPLMLFRCCPMQGKKGCGSCDGRRQLTDRQGEKLTVLCHRKQYSSLLNPVPLYVSDRDLRGLDFQLAYFTTEDARTCRSVAARMAAGEPFESKRTLGPYYRSML